MSVEWLQLSSDINFSFYAVKSFWIYLVDKQNPKPMEKDLFQFEVLEKSWECYGKGPAIPEADAKIVGDVLLQATSLDLTPMGVNRFKSNILTGLEKAY